MTSPLRYKASVTQGEISHKEKYMTKDTIIFNIRGDRFPQTTKRDITCHLSMDKDIIVCAKQLQQAALLAAETLSQNAEGHISAEDLEMTINPDQKGTFLPIGKQVFAFMDNPKPRLKE